LRRVAQFSDALSGYTFDMAAAHVEKVNILEADNTTVTAAGSDASVLISVFNGGADNTFIGGNGDDVVNGQLLTESTMHGGAGNDLLAGGDAGDIIYGDVRKVLHMYALSRLRKITNIAA